MADLLTLEAAKAELKTVEERRKALKAYIKVLEAREADDTAPDAEA